MATAFGIAFSFNSVPIPGVGGLDEVVNSNIDQLSIIGRDGVKSNTGRIGSRAITINGTIVSTDGTQSSPLNQWNTLLNALYDDDGGNIKQYLIANQQVRIEAQLSSHTYGYTKNNAGMLALNYRLGLQCDSPYWENLAATVQPELNMSTGGTLTIAEADMGGMYSWPSFTVASATGITSDVVLTNNTTSAVWTFGANVAAGETLAVIMKTHAVTNDGDDAIADVTHPSSDWFILRGGAANEIQLDFAGGASDVALVATWTKRWLTFPDILA